MKQAVTLSQISHDQFTAISEVSSDWVWQIDAKGRYTFVSDKVCDFLGYQPKEMLGKSPLDFMEEKEAERVAAAFQVYLQDHAPFRDLENTCLHKDGHRVTFLSSGFPVFDNQQQFQGYRGIDRDISELKRLIRHLEEVAYNLKQAQKLAKIGHWELDLTRDTLYWSDETYRIFGLEPQSILPTYDKFLEYVHPDDHHKVNQAYTQSVANQQPYQIVHRVVTAQHQLKHVEERCEHVLDDDKKVIKSIGTVHDITEKVEKDKQIQLVSKVFDYSTDAILITDEKNQIIAVNQAFTRLTGYSFEEARGQNPKLLSSGWGDQAFYQQMWQEVEQNGIWQGEVRDRRKDGRLYMVKQSIIAIQDEQGNVTNYIGISHDITDAKHQEQKIKKLAYYDFLTQLPNRTLFKEEAENLIKSSHYQAVNFALLFLDLDNFKWVNDTLGHRTGDEVLMHVAKSLQAQMPEGALIGRLGGDEFLILLPFNETMEVSQAAEALIADIQSPIRIHQQVINMGWSIGISVFPNNAQNYDELLKNADMAMYAAKNRGKNNYQYFNDEMNRTAHQRMQVYNRLKSAILNDGFHLVYQPKHDAQTQKITSVEALIRWQDEKLGFVGPDVFIPIAEESGLIVEIGDWVFEQAMKDKLSMTEQGVDAVTVAINVSVRQLEQKDFIDKIESWLERYPLQACDFEIELTESTLMSNIDEFADMISRLSQMGFAISIDDFGTGYSSLQYLNQLSFDTLKIDKTFVDEIENKGKPIAQAILSLSKSLQFESVAEGVETIQQARLLKEMGCSMMQGYLFSKPIPLHELIDYQQGFRPHPNL